MITGKWGLNIEVSNVVEFCKTKAMKEFIVMTPY